MSRGPQPVGDVDVGLALLEGDDTAEPSRAGGRSGWLLLALLGLLALAGLGLLLAVAAVDAPSPSRPWVSIDYSDEPDGSVLADGDLTQQVVHGWLQVRHGPPGPMYAFVTQLPPSPSMTVSATMRWPDGPAPADGLVTGGVMLLDAQRAGYALTCGTDGNAYLWVVQPGWSIADSYLPDAGCGRQFGLSLQAVGDEPGTLLVHTPDGAVARWAPAGTSGPFTEAGWVSLLEDQARVVPGLDIARYEVSVGSP